MTENGFTLGEARRRIEDLEDYVRTQTAANNALLSRLTSIETMQARHDERLGTIVEQMTVARKDAETARTEQAANKRVIVGAAVTVAFTTLATVAIQAIQLVGHH